MGAAHQVLILGGYGTFGSLLAKELLATTNHSVILGGRSSRRAQAVRSGLGHPGRVSTIEVDLSKPDLFGRALAGVDAVVCAAGPFQQLSPQLVLNSVQAGVHWLDIADDPDWIASVVHDRETQGLALEKDLVVAPGMSTSPAISSALAELCRRQLPAATSMRVALFIGNRNRKGAGVVASGLLSCDGPLEQVDLLAFGRRTGWRAPSADAVMFGSERDIASRFVLIPEWRLGLSVLRVTARLGARGARSATAMAWLARWSSAFGTNEGSIDVALYDEAGGTCAMACTGTQRIAILPCAIALGALDQPALHVLRRQLVAEVTSPEALIAGLESRGMRLVGPVMTKTV